MSTLGERIRTVRKDLGMSRAEFSKRLDISQTTLFNYESSERFPTIEIITKISKLFHVPAVWLLTGKGLMRYEDLSYLMPLLTDEIINIINKHLNNIIPDDIKENIYYDTYPLLTLFIQKLFEDKIEIDDQDCKQFIDKLKIDLTRYFPIDNIEQENYNNPLAVENKVDVDSDSFNFKIDGSEVIGSDSFLTNKISGLFDSISIYYSFFFKDQYYEEMYNNFMEYFKIPKIQKFTSYLLWPKYMASDILIYLENKRNELLSSIEKEKIFSDKKIEYKLLIAEIFYYQSQIGISNDNVATILNCLFGVSSYPLLSTLQLNNYRDFLKKAVKKI